MHNRGKFGAGGSGHLWLSLHNFSSWVDTVNELTGIDRLSTNLHPIDPTEVESPLKVLHAVYGLGLGGVERSAQNFALETQKAGHETSVVALSDGPRRSRLEEAGIRVFIGQEVDALPLQDVIGLNSHGLPDDFVTSLITKHANARIWEKNVFSSPSPWMHRLDASFQLSPWAHWLYAKRGGDTQRSSTLSNPINAGLFWSDEASGNEFRKQHGIPLAALVLGRVGQPLTMKWNPRLYSDVCKVVSEKRDRHLLLVGAPIEVAHLVQSKVDRSQYTLIESLDTDDDLRSAYNAMNLFVHAARQGESFGNVIAEAGLCGVATLTVATPWADNSQGFVAGPSGLTASSRRDFSRLLRECLAATDSLEDRGQAARTHVLENFSADVVTEEVLGVTLGQREAIQAPNLAELDTQEYFGSQAPSWLLRQLPDTAKAFLAGAISGQEPWTWAVTKQLNSLGLSRHGIRRQQAP